MKTPVNKSERHLKFLQRRHSQTGFDSDYIDKLGPEALAWLDEFARGYYDGDPSQSQEHKKEANQRRYRAKSADVMSKISDVAESVVSVDDLDPEKLLMLKEQLSHKK